MKYLSGCGLLLCVGSWLLGAFGAHAQSSEPMFKGKTINLYIATSSGGSYDLVGRLIARHMPKHLSGNPQIVAQNMPGAGGIAMGNFLFNVAPKDGTAFGIAIQSIAVEEALKTSGLSYRSADFNWIGRAASSNELIMSWHTAKAKSVSDATETEVPIAGAGPGTPGEGMARLLNAIRGTKFKIISGYTGSTPALLAMEKGEVDAAQTSWGTLKATKETWIDKKLINIMLQAALVREPELSTVPALVEFGKSPDDKAILALYSSSSEIGRSFLAPPGVPADRIAALRSAFTATMNDAEFRAEASRAKADMNPLPGEKLQELIRGIIDVKPEVAARMKTILAAPK